MDTPTLTTTLDELIVALCADYPRRRRAIESHTMSHRTDTEFRYYNFFIFEAAAEIIGSRYAEDFIREIGEEVGYAKSRVDCMCESTYKNYKREIKCNIARKLHLDD